MFDRDDTVPVSDFIDIDNILKYVSEEQIFELVFGYQPVEFNRVVSPFRKDKTPGCWFQYYPSGKLKFVDFGTTVVIKGRRMINMDCFDAVQVYYKLPNLFQTLNFIKKHLIDGKELKEKPVSVNIAKEKKDVEIFIEVRNFEDRDRRYFSKYEITKQNLIDDNVFPVKRIKVLNTKFGDYSNPVFDLCYAHTDFPKGRKKLHRPEQKGKHRFLSNCRQDDIYGYKYLPESGQKLIITKSYKDFRVLKNRGLTVIGFQNEGMIPSDEVLLDILRRFESVIVFFDNDATGISEGERVTNYINFHFPGLCRQVYINPELFAYGISDPSDLIEKMGRKELIQFLAKKKLFNEPKR